MYLLKDAVQRLPEVLSHGRNGKHGRQEELEARLYQQIGQLTMQLDYLKEKVRSLPVEQRRTMIERESCQLSIRAQCRLLGVNRSMVVLRAPRR
jgi:hypothetical protein